MNPSSTRLSGRYERIAVQLSELFEENPDAQSRMATAVALLHHKMSHFFWTGFYRLVGEDLIVGPYQGPLACSVLLPRGAGVCWAGITRGESILVPDVRQFEGHIACDSRSRSEVVVPCRDRSGNVVGVLDVDSVTVNALGREDVIGLERIVALVNEIPHSPGQGR